MSQKAKKLKVIHIVRQYSPAIGGLESFVKSLATQQSENGLDVEVITLNRVFHQKIDSFLEAKEIIDGIKVIRIPYQGSYKYPFAFRVLKKIRTADIVHVHAIDFFADFLAVTKLIHKKPLIISTHGGFFHTNYASKLKNIFFNVVTRSTMKCYRAVVACSENDFSQFQSINTKRLYLIENGIDTEKFQLQSSKKANKCLAFVGRFSENKRIDLLLIFFSKLVNLSDEYQLLVIGRDWDNTLYNINKQIEQLNISEHVTILTGLNDFEIKTQLDKASFVVSASEYEGFGMSIIEGMSAGLIPICSKIPSFTKILETANIGVNINFNELDNVSIVDKFINDVLLDHDNKVHEVILSAKKYSWPIKALEFDQVYETVLGNLSRNIQGIKIDVNSSEKVIERLDNQISENNKTMLAFANAHTVNIANRDPEFKRMLKSFLILNDGIGLQIASKLKYGKGFVENLNGTDFVPNFFSETKHTLNIFLLGATESTVKKAFNVWSNLYSHHKWCGYNNGYFKNESDQELIDKINNSGADVLIVAMGNPIQEKWIYQNRKHLNIKLAIGVGALFDFTAGKVARAPKWLQTLKIEWLYRLIQEPKRLWKRYIIGNVIFLWNAIKD